MAASNSLSSKIFDGEKPIVGWLIAIELIAGFGVAFLLGNGAHAASIFILLAQGMSIALFVLAGISFMLEIHLFVGEFDKKDEKDKGEDGEGNSEAKEGQWVKMLLVNTLFFVIGGILFNGIKILFTDVMPIPVADAKILLNSFLLLPGLLVVFRGQLGTLPISGPVDRQAADTVVFDYCA